MVLFLTSLTCTIGVIAYILVVVFPVNLRWLVSQRPLAQ